MKIDPRSRLIIVLCFSTLSVLALDIVYLAFVFFAVLLMDFILQIDLIAIIKRIKFLLSMIVFITILQSLTIRGGKAIISIGSLNLITLNGIIKGGEFALRMIIIIFSSAVVIKAEGREMIDGLIKMRVPYEIAFMTSVALRFLPYFKEEFSARLNAVRMRGINIKKLSLQKKLKVYSYIIFPTVSGSIIKSKELASAMEARAFRAYDKRTMLRALKFNFRDYAIISTVITIFALFLGIMYIKGGLI